MHKNKIPTMIKNLFAAFQLPSFESGDIGTFISSLYDLSILIVGVVIFVQFIVAGFQYLTAGGNSGKIGDANNRMKNAVIGTVLLFSAYLILNVINPQLLNNAFDLSGIKDKIYKPAIPFNVKCVLDVCRDAKNPQEQQLKDVGVDWGVRDVSGMSQKTILELGKLRANCDCTLATSYEKKARW